MREASCILWCSNVYIKLAFLLKSKSFTTADKQFLHFLIQIKDKPMWFKKFFYWNIQPGGLEQTASKHAYIFMNEATFSDNVKI